MTEVRSQSPAIRLLAITPPEGDVDGEVLDAWAAGVAAGSSGDPAGRARVSLAILLRTPGENPDVIVAPRGRLAAVMGRARALGVPLVLSCDPRELGIGTSIVNDLDLAGLHLRGDPDLTTLLRARAQLPAAWLGRSVHGEPGPREAAARDLVDYTCFAPVFPPSTPQAGVTKVAAGLVALRRWTARDRRVLALGGIRASNVHAALEAGAAGVASIGQFFGARAEVGKHVGALATAVAEAFDEGSGLRAPPRPVRHAPPPTDAR
jgi:thiamine monophosphate synthase